MMPTDVEATVRTRSRRTTKLDTAASRRLINNALGLRSNSRNGDRIMSTLPRKSSKSSTAGTKSSRRKSKEADEPLIQHEGEQSMDIDDEEESAGGHPSNSTWVQVEESIDHLNSVLRRYIPKSKSRSEGDQTDAEDDDESDSDNVWEDPMKAFRDIQEARERMMDACDKHEERVLSQESRRRSEDEEGDSQQDKHGDTEEEFRALYMNTMTTAFAAELDGIRTGRASTKKGKRTKGGARKATDTTTMMDADNIFVDPDHMKDDADEEEEKEKEPLVQENIDVEVLVEILQGGMISFSAKGRKMLIEESKRRSRKNEVAAEEEEDVMTPHERRRKMLVF